MSAANHLRRAISFLAHNSRRTAFRAVPLALATVALSHALTRPLTAITAQAVTGCNSDTVSGTSMNGSVTNGGMGLTLSGAASVQALRTALSTSTGREPAAGTLAAATARLAQTSL